MVTSSWLESRYFCHKCFFIQVIVASVTFLTVVIKLERKNVARWGLTAESIFAICLSSNITLTVKKVLGQLTILHSLSVNRTWRFSSMWPAGLVDEISSIAHPFILGHQDDDRGRGTCEWARTGGRQEEDLATTYPSARGQSRFGPRTMAMLLGVILFTACCSDNRDKNWTRYLTGREKGGR